MTTKTKKAKPAAPETSLVLRVSGPNGESHGGFVWPLTVGAEVVCPDWINNSECGNGLHGWLYGQGDHTVANHWNSEGAKWLVLEVVSADVCMLGGKVKFPRCTVRFVGTKSEAANYIIEHEPRAAAVAVIGMVREVGDNGACEGGALSCLTGGDGSTLTGGDGSTLTGGYGSTLTGGARSTLTGGYRSTLTGGYGSTLTGGARSTLTGGDGSTLTGGYGSTLTGGARSTLTGGYRSTLTGGYGSTLTGGARSTLTGGYGSTLTGGEKAELRFQRYDEKADRYRTVLAYVGEDGIEAGKAYRLDDAGKVVEVQP